MKWFRITVNGRAYDVEVEEVDGFAAPLPRPVAFQQPPKVPEAPAQAALAPLQPVIIPQPAAVPQGGAKVLAPMPGKILSVKAGPGQAVKRGDVLMILEAMKMENEIQSPADGAVTAIAVTEGASVSAGALLAVVG